MEEKKRKRGWECPVCLEANFPYVGKCGHSVCEDCQSDLDKCPICRKIGAFKEAVPCWALASAMGVEKKATPDLFETHAKDLANTFASIGSLASIAAKIMERKSTIVTKAQLESLKRQVGIVNQSFNDDCMNLYIPRIEKLYKTNPTKIDVSGSICGATALLTNLKSMTKGRLHGHGRKNVMYVKPMI